MMHNTLTATPFEVPTWRLHALRAMYLLIVVGLGLMVWPSFFHRTHPWTLMGGVVASMLVAFSSLSLLGLRYPLQMLPILLWETIWKCVWLGAIAGPQWAAGRMDADTLETVFQCSMVVLVVLVIPWRHVLQRYVLQRGERWSSAG